MTRTTFSAAAIAALVAFPALADLDSAPIAINLQPEPTPDAAPAATPAPLDTAPAAVAFGTAGSRWWTVGAGVAQSFHSATDLSIHGAYTYFLDTDVEFTGELAAWYYGDGDDAFGINPQMIFRWHFFNNQKWTMYGDIGIGVLFASDDVPDGGSSFNFTPRVGGGVTRLLNDSGLRWQAGVRWAHISNARITGDEDNPSRDSVMFYTGLIWPF